MEVSYTFGFASSDATHTKPLCVLGRETDPRKRQKKKKVDGITVTYLVSATFYCFYDLVVLTLLYRPHQRLVMFCISSDARMIAIAPRSDSARSSTLFNVPFYLCFCFRVSWVGLLDII